MPDTGLKRRRAFALALYLSSVLGAFGTLLMLRLAYVSYLRHRHTGDLAGASMGLMFILTTLAPLTLIALALALWLWPVSGWLARSRSAAAGETPSAARRWLRRATVAASAIAATAVMATAGLVLAYGVNGGYQDYGIRGFNLVRLAIQDLILLSPLLILSGLLFCFAASVARSPRSP